MPNAFVRPEVAEPPGRVETATLMMCDDCALIQLREVLPDEELLRNVIWVAGTSATLRRHAASLATRLARQHGRGKRLVELMSNDGILLAACREAGFDVLGVDPTPIAAEAAARGLPCLMRRFGADAAREILARQGPADVIVARHTFAHTGELADLMAGVDLLLAPGGRLIVEVPYALTLRDELQYDTIFHEHVCYWTASPCRSRYRVRVVAVQ